MFCILKIQPNSGKAKPGEICVNSVKTYLAGVQSFFEYNDIVLNWKKIIKYCPEQVTNNLRAYTKEEIVKLQSLADLRDRCFILLMASTGMRVGAFKTLRKKHLKKLDDGNIAVGYLINILIKYKDKLRINIADAFLRILENVNLEKSQINQIENFFSTLNNPRYNERLEKTKQKRIPY